MSINPINIVPAEERIADALAVIADSLAVIAQAAEKSAFYAEQNAKAIDGLTDVVYRAGLNRG